MCVLWLIDCCRHFSHSCPFFQHICHIQHGWSVDFIFHTRNSSSRIVRIVVFVFGLAIKINMHIWVTHFGCGWFGQVVKWHFCLYSVANGFFLVCAPWEFKSTCCRLIYVQKYGWRNEISFRDSKNYNMIPC